jgi:hypothetical protein
MISSNWSMIRAKRGPLPAGSGGAAGASGRKTQRRAAVAVGVGGAFAGQPRQKVGQGDVGQPRRQRCGRAAALLQAGQQVEKVDVVHGLRARRQRAGDAAHRQHLEAFVVAQPRDQAGVEQRTLARARLGVEEQQPFRHDPRQQVARLALAAKEAVRLALGEGARADVGIIYVHKLCSFSAYARTSPQKTSNFTSRAM